MEQTIDNAKQFLNSEQGQGLKQQLFGGDKPTGDPQTDAPTYDAQGNQGAPGQFGQEGQFGAVTGKGFGGGFAGNQYQQGQGQGNQQAQEKQSDYEGMEVEDSTATGGYGRNAQGSSFSRQNQMGADHDNHANPGGVYDNDDDHKDGMKTGYSTPGYRKEGEDEEENARRLNQNVYGKQADDSGAKGNDYNEAEI
uniref:Uncharacterized protein n=1 Tax=Kwoniella dejecticola CBS 10117 TaxID=1296121 RepID=A0A1A5ZYF5_9TREE|nr:uncharacterized protein I303_06396 [Kwoniella dejecticola CBS 10117]OBR82839.1 hypothetical protein I303_06396 [Kwoniella dejecticola CBS 10117]